MDPVAQNIQKLLPLPNAGRESMLVNNFEVVNNPNEDRDIPSIKIDHNIGVKSHLSFFFSSYGPHRCLMRTPSRLPSPQRASGMSGRTHIGSTYDYTVTPTFLVHAGAGYVRWTQSRRRSPVGLRLPRGLAAACPASAWSAVLLLVFPNIVIGTGTANTGGMGTIGVGNGSLQYDDKPTGVSEWHLCPRRQTIATRPGSNGGETFGP